MENSSNELSETGATTGLSEQRQQGTGQNLGQDQPPESDMVIPSIREPEAGFLRGDSYPGRRSLERR